MKTLSKISQKYQSLNFNDDNYSIGGGLSDGAFASRRHEDAKYDAGKLTEGKAVQMFKKATGLDIDQVKAVINYVVPNMEWHHAGKLPKQYGGGMKKTYFLNASEIIDLANNWATYADELSIYKENLRIENEERKSLAQRQQEFLKTNATYFNRVSISVLSGHYITMEREMQGKYGWFNAEGKSYNLPVYYSGYAFETAELRDEYFKIK